MLACGIRKMWAKEFKELDRPSQQIKRLKEILAELGMTGRLSLEQAKSIKERRELAQELGVSCDAFGGDLICEHDNHRGRPLIREICCYQSFDSGSPQSGS